jgi:hypothetical protein
MVDDLLFGRVTSFRREQGFGVITLEDGRAVKFDASDCTMVPEEGGAVRLRVGPARWGGGIKALHVEPLGSSTIMVPSAPPSLDHQIAAVQREHLAGTLSEHVMAQLVATAFGGKLGAATLIDVLDAFYAADPARRRADGYLRLSPGAPAVEAVAAIASLVPGIAMPRALEASSVDDAAAQANQALEAAGDPRRLYRLRMVPDRRAYLVLTADRAQRLAGLLPFAS